MPRGTALSITVYLIWWLYPKVKEFPVHYSVCVALFAVAQISARGENPDDSDQIP